MCKEAKQTKKKNFKKKRTKKNQNHEGSYNLGKTFLKPKKIANLKYGEKIPTLRTFRVRHWGVNYENFARRNCIRLLKYISL